MPATLVVVTSADGEDIRIELYSAGVPKNGPGMQLSFARNLGAGYRARSGNVAKERDGFFLVDEVEKYVLGFASLPPSSRLTSRMGGRQPPLLVDHFEISQSPSRMSLPKSA